MAERCKQGARVLNIGVGSGELERLLLQRGVTVSSLDPSAATIARLRAQLPIGNRARQGYAQKMEFESQSFDKVIMTEVLEHLSDNVLDETLDEVRRVLKAAGEFTGTVPFRENLKASEVICPSCHSVFHRWGHQQTFTIDSLRDLLLSHGFRVRTNYPRSFPDFRRKGLRPFLRACTRYALGRVGEQLVGPSLYFVAIRD